MKKSLLLLAGLLFVITIATAFMIRLVPVPKQDAAALAEEHFSERDKALSAIENRRFNEAELSLFLVRRHWPRDRVADRLAIRLYFETDRLNEAEKRIRQLLRESPEDGLLFNALGCVCWARRKYLEAEKLLLQAARLKTDSAGILLNLAAVQQSRRKTAEAQRSRNAAALLILAGVSADTGELVRLERYRPSGRASQPQIFTLPEIRPEFLPSTGKVTL